MVIMHANGDIVTMPDHAENYKRRQRRYECTGKCIYGVVISGCQDWQNEHAANPKVYRKDLTFCTLSGCGACTRYAKKVFSCNQPKSFTVDNKQYRKIADRAAWLKENSKNKLLFITLTFGGWIQKPISDENANECFSNYMDNLKKNYGRGNYIAVRERSDDHTKRLHYHCIIELPFVDFRALNSGWCNAIRDYCHYSKNALTTRKNHVIIKSTVSAVRYICKYVSKCRGQRSESRLIFVSREVAQAEITKDFSGNDLNDVLSQFRSIQVYKHHDFCWRYSISTPPGATKEQKERSIRAENAWYYQVVRAIFGINQFKKSELSYFKTD